ncbi:hypothetical protein [Streptomyces sp. N2A]|uniref:hypothetical protein n=1 Tax=Streptomyces sp. N2A TaxID=3073936 RepID=UPI00287019DF|nr:hypothetical protein [Streptomyces sp. N2A]
MREGHLTYRLTDSGRAAFAEWLVVPPGPENIRYPLLLTLSFGQFLDDDRLLEDELPGILRGSDDD